MQSSNTPIRVVFGINDFLVGGAQTLIIEQLTRLNREQFAPVLITLQEFPEPKTLFDRVPSGVPVHRLNFRSITNLRAWWQLYKLLKELRPTVVVSHLFFSNTVFRVLSFFLPFRVITVEHNTYIYKKWHEILADRLLARRSSRMIAVSSTVADYAARQAHIPRTRYEVVPNGIDTTAIEARLVPKEEARKKLSLPEGRVFITVSRLAYQKNHKGLIEGFSQYVREGGEGILLIVGDGPLRAVLEAQARDSGAGERIIFTGLQKDVSQWYSAADVFLSTSAIEGFSYAHLEAAAAGLPLITTRTAGADELVLEGGNGHFIPFDDAGALAAALHALSDEAIVRYGQVSRARVERFAIERNVQEYESLISAVAA